MWGNSHSLVQCWFSERQSSQRPVVIRLNSNKKHWIHLFFLKKKQANKEQDCRLSASYINYRDNYLNEILKINRTKGLFFIWEDFLFLCVYVFSFVWAITENLRQQIRPNKEQLSTTTEKQCSALWQTNVACYFDRNTIMSSITEHTMTVPQ